LNIDFRFGGLAELSLGEIVMKINLKTVLLLVGVSLIVRVPCVLAHTDVTAEQAHELIGSTDDLTVIDVREPYEYCGARGHIPGALNYPWNSGVLRARYEELPMDGPILVVCQSGGRSNQAATFLDSHGFYMVYDMLGGMNAWKWETVIGDQPYIKYSGGTGEPNDPYQIATTEDLILLGETLEDYDKHFILTADIDLDPNLPGRKVFDKAVIAPDVNDNDGEFQGTPFTGIFNGNGHAVSNLTIVGGEYLGLFGKLESGAKVKDLGIVDVNVTGSDSFVGELVGYNHCSSVSHCYSTGRVSGNCYVGGLVGGEDGTVTGCYSDSTVSGIESIGGLVGSGRSGDITECYSAGTVSGGSYVGGLVGFIGIKGAVTLCYSTSVVSGIENVGGLVGCNGGGDITMSYSSGFVSGTDSSVGGLVGLTYTISDTGLSFWDTQTSGQNKSAGGTGLTTAEMQTASTFIDAGWDFVDETANGTEDIWCICEGTNYPRFVWQIPASDFVCPDGITIEDFSFFLEHWLDDNCDSSNGYCEGTDLDKSGTVDAADLEIFFENWSAEQK
jgi:rhodanese-related sulfurtransferase